MKKWSTHSDCPTAQNVQISHQSFAIYLTSTNSAILQVQMNVCQNSQNKPKLRPGLCVFLA